jgi:hypothetical protein
MKKGQSFSPSTLVTSATILRTIGPEISTTIISPIPSLTPLATSFGTPSSEVVHINKITPILHEEMPPSSFFFKKKRKAIVKKESQQKDGVVSKRQKIVYDGKCQMIPSFPKRLC